MLMLLSFTKKDYCQKIWEVFKKKGRLDEIIRQQEAKFSLAESMKLYKEAIRSRYYQGSLTVTTMGPVSPMAAVEPQLVEFILRMSRICRCLTATQCLLLVNDLVKCTKYEQEVIAFKERRYKRKFDSADLGQNYWKGLKKDGIIHWTLKEGRNLHWMVSCTYVFKYE